MKTLDTRNLQERLEELETAFNEWKDSLSAEQIAEIKGEYLIPDGENLTDEEFGWKWADEVGSDADELKNLIELREEFRREWLDGVELILGVKLR